MMFNAKNRTYHQCQKNYIKILNHFTKNLLKHQSENKYTEKTDDV